MSAEGRLGSTKLARAEKFIGEPLLMAFASHPWVEGVTPDDRHFEWNTRTGKVAPVEDPTHWTCCPTVVARNRLLPEPRQDVLDDRAAHDAAMSAFWARRTR